MPQAAISQIYRRLYRRSRPLTGQITPGTTPNEFVDLLQSSVQEASRSSYIKNFLPPVVGEAKGLTRIYNRRYFMELFDLEFQRAQREEQFLETHREEILGMSVGGGIGRLLVE